MNETEKCKKKILVVEDEQIIGNICCRILSNEGFDVDLVNNGLIATEAASTNDYDLFISDIKLPGITGIQLYEQLKVTQPELSRRWLFMTGDSMNDYIHMFLNKTGIPCILKPFFPEEFVVAVKKISEQIY